MAAGDPGEGTMQQWVDISGTSFSPLVVVELATNTTEEAIKWLLGRIRDKQQSGGVERRADLLYSRVCFLYLQLHVHVCQVPTCWWSSWDWECGVRRRKTPTSSWWGLRGRDSCLVLRRWDSLRSTMMDP